LCKKALVIDDDPELGGEAVAISDTVAEITLNNAKISTLLKGGTRLAFNAFTLEQ
jgi:hypothetical protein